MFIEILLFILAGFFLGVLFGLLPGIHPNMMILLIPFFTSLGMEPMLFLSFVVSMAVANSTVNFIPSIFLGAPDSGTELSVLPGHRMLLSGNGHNAVKLAAIGSLGSVVFCAAAFPLMLFIIPPLFSALSPYVYAILSAIVIFMVLTETGTRKIVSAAVFFISGFIGMAISYLPVDNTLALFPVVSGLFGIPSIILQLKNRTVIPEQSEKEIFMSKKSVNRSIASGSLSGIFAGMLPGIGSSEIASLTSTNKDGKYFLVKLSSLTTTNIILSIMALWLIGKSRSGVSVLIGQIMNIGFNEAVFVLVVSLIAVGMAVIASFHASRIIIRIMSRVSYHVAGIVVLSFILLMVIAFTGIIGAALLLVSSGLGIFANLAGIKRGIMMGVLILPTILFYLP